MHCQVDVAPTQPPPQEVPNSLPINTTATTTLSADALESDILSSPNSPSEDMIGGIDLEKKKHNNKRGIFPKHATNIMKAWLFQHLVVSTCGNQL